MLFLIPVLILCRGHWQIGNQAFVFIATWYPSLAIYALTELGCGQPNKPRWDCRDMRQGDHVPALEGLFILHVKLQVYRFTSSFHFLPNPTQTSGSQ